VRRSDRRIADPTAVSELLERVRSLRLTLTADLAAAAGAIDEGQPGVARDILAADSAELGRLTSTGAARQRDCPARPHRRRALLALPAIPLIGVLAMSGAAAVSIHNSDRVARHTGSARSSGLRAPPAVLAGKPRRSAASTLVELSRVVSRHPPASEIAETTTTLHDQIRAMITDASGSTEQLSRIQAMLSEEQQLLERWPGPGIATALAASRELSVTALDTSRSAARLAPLPSVPVITMTTTTPRPESSPTNTPANTQHSAAPTHPASRHHHSRPTSTHHRQHWQIPLFGSGLLGDPL
jgi:hypothetical protein